MLSPLGFGSFRQLFLSSFLECVEVDLSEIESMFKQSWETHSSGNVFSDLMCVDTTSKKEDIRLRNCLKKTYFSNFLFRRH